MKAIFAFEFKANKTNLSNLAILKSLFKLVTIKTVSTLAASVCSLPSLYFSFVLSIDSFFISFFLGSIDVIVLL